MSLNDVFSILTLEEFQLHMKSLSAINDDYIDSKINLHDVSTLRCLCSHQKNKRDFLFCSGTSLCFLSDEFVHLLSSSRYTY